MRKLQRHSGHSRPGERSLPETIRSLDRVASLMGLPRPVKDEAGFICKKALEKGLVRGRSIEAIVAAAVYAACRIDGVPRTRSEEHTSELQSPVVLSYAVFCLKKTKSTSYHSPRRRSCYRGSASRRARSKARRPRGFFV